MNSCVHPCVLEGDKVVILAEIPLVGVAPITRNFHFHVSTSSVIAQLDRLYAVNLSASPKPDLRYDTANFHYGLFLAVRCVLDQRPLCKSLRSHLLRHTSLPDLQPKITSLHELNICLFPSKKQRSAITLVARYTDMKAAYPWPYSLRTDAV